MKVYELIKKLQEILNEHGNVSVVGWNRNSAQQQEFTGVTFVPNIVADKDVSCIILDDTEDVQDCRNVT